VAVCIIVFVAPMAVGLLCHQSNIYILKFSFLTGVFYLGSKFYPARSRLSHSNHNTDSLIYCVKEVLVHLYQFELLGSYYRRVEKQLLVLDTVKSFY